MRKQINKPRKCSVCQLLKPKVRESQRRANVGGIIHEPGNPIMSDIQVDEEFSKLCSESH